jgi:hypothetical protein
MLFLSTLACTLLGWSLGNEHRSARTGIVDRILAVSAQTLAINADRDGPERRIAVDQAIAGIRANFKEGYFREEQSARLFDRLRELENSDFLTAIATLSSEPDWVGFEGARLLAGYWAERDLPAALRWALSLNEAGAGRFCPEVFETWSWNDLPEMLDWVEKHAAELPSKQRDCAVFAAARAAWRLDPDRGIRLVRRLNLKGEEFIWAIYHDWAENDPAVAATRVLREVDPKIRERSILALTNSWARRDPFAARAWAETIPDPLLAQKTVTQIGSVLAWIDPPAAANYLVQIPQTNDTRTALKEAAGNWAKRDLDTVLKWAAAVENKPLGDWVADAVKASLPRDQRATVEERWREFRNIDTPSPTSLR